MTLFLNVALIHKLHVSLMCLDYFLDILAWLFIQPGIGRRPVDRCKNEMSVLYLPPCTHEKETFKYKATRGLPLTCSQKVEIEWAFSWIVPTFSSCTTFVGRPGMMHDCASNCHQVSWAWMHG